MDELNPSYWESLLAGVRIMTPEEAAADDVAREERARRMHEARAAARLAMFEESLPKRAVGMRFDSELIGQHVPPLAIEMAMNCANERKKRVVLVGGAGTGKTSLAAAMLREAFHQGAVVAFCRAYKLATARIQARAGQGEQSDVLEAMRAAVVVIDDVGNERHTQVSALPDVLYERDDQDLVTWITTGHSPEMLASRYGDGVARRVYEGAYVINLAGGQ